MRPCKGEHGEGAVCWRCSNQVAWWAEARAKAGYELWAYVPSPAVACREDDCPSPYILARGLCSKHYHSWYYQEVTKSA